MKRYDKKAADLRFIKVDLEKNMESLFSDQEMQKLILHIQDPLVKEKKLFLKGTYHYRQNRYSIVETAQLLGISVKALKALQDQGEIQFKKSGDKIQFYAGDIRRFLIKCAKRQY